jgi:hypothetical protein
VQRSRGRAQQNAARPTRPAYIGALKCPASAIVRERNPWRFRIMWKTTLAATLAAFLVAGCGDDAKAKAKAAPAAESSAAPAAAPVQAAPAAAPAQAAPAAVEEKKDAAEAKPNGDKLPGEQNQ